MVQLELGRHPFHDDRKGTPIVATQFKTKYVLRIPTVIVGSFSPLSNTSIQYILWNWTLFTWICMKSPLANLISCLCKKVGANYKLWDIVPKYSPPMTTRWFSSSEHKPFRWFLLRIRVVGA